MKDLTKTYSNDDITIVWKPAMCIHSTKCWKGETGLPEVFNPREKPWIKATGAATDAIIKRVTNCPSGALSFHYNNQANHTPEETISETIIEVTEKGPLLVYGNITVKHTDKREDKKTQVTAFCRCGASANKPFCDGTHVKTGFKD